MAGLRIHNGSTGLFEREVDVRGMEGAIDFSSNLNPLGMPMQVVRAIKVAAADFEVYPDPLCCDLAEAIAEHEGLEAGNVVVTAGVSDALARLGIAMRLRKVLVCSPSYLGYEQALRPFWPRVVHHSLVARENFDVTERIVDYIEPDIDCVFLASPNNPTGRVIGLDLLDEILQAADRLGVHVVVDESYIELTEYPTCASLLDRHPSLIVLRGFSETYAMAGFRLGYCLCGQPDIAQAIRAAGQPWAVSAPAQVAGLAALDVPRYLDLSREYVSKGRSDLSAGLAEAGMLVVPSDANFVLFKAELPLRDALLERGVVVCSCEGFRGLDATWHRVCVRKHEENAKFIKALREVLMQ